jgi:tRNA A37 threonylcarbamoyladenosine dehydratase
MTSPDLPAAAPTESTDASQVDFERRFGGVARLYGAAALQRFRQAHVCVVGVGGVGSWAVEALARSAIGKITMIDLDNLAESNVNRQIHALSDTLGKAKVSALAERIALINPFCAVTEIEDFLTPDNLDWMIGEHAYDYVIDAIDNVQAKVALIAYCRDHALPLLTVGSAGGQTDPTRIEVRDLSKTEQEPLLAKVRKRLRSHHRFPRGDRNRFGVDAVFSTEPVRIPVDASCDIDGNPSDGNPSDGNPSDGITGLNCAGYGSAVVVTASFGLVAVAHVLRKLAEPDRIDPPASA